LVRWLVNDTGWVIAADKVNRTGMYTLVISHHKCFSSGRSLFLKFIQFNSECSYIYNILTEVQQACVI